MLKVKYLCRLKVNWHGCCSLEGVMKDAEKARIIEEILDDFISSDIPMRIGENLISLCEEFGFKL